MRLERRLRRAHRQQAALCRRIAAREFDETGDPAIKAWRQSLFPLYTVFQGWPSDHEAVTSTDADALRLFTISEANKGATKAEYERENGK